ncbi:hypothetical protein CBW24_08695 [Pacificitalea manganoxidans]|uniref:Helix-turn-helix domain-containing protein n=1 Tax=Pacificitalea manganoxidans TaxID=1411902 RepID=A0A291LZX9_9RHOB|nr:excisionase family DNA-binding protein [Pacificitalea manganoxidans]ATI42078.1 hypothetical protein CBW24_08695 [Pacificitalea manganoxidans]MDR6308124.1 excisionase family DNA binding protein [Pacificitalea manganoxidans]
MEARILTPDDVARRWGCSATMVRKLISDGELPAFRVGRLMRIPYAAVEKAEGNE